MNRIKFVNEPSDLVAVLRAVDTDIKKKIFQELSQDWKTTSEIVEKYGRKGKDALSFFEKMKLVETRWEQKEGGSEKAYHTYYSSFHINTTCPILEISEILHVATMSDKKFREIEKKIIDMVGKNGVFIGDVAEKLDISQTMLRSIIKRSSVLEYRGHTIELVKD